MIKIVLNGKEKEYEIEFTLLDLISSLNLRPDRIVAQVNGEIVGRDKYHERWIRNGDQVELIKFMAGGQS